MVADWRKVSSVRLRSEISSVKSQYRPHRPGHRARGWMVHAAIAHDHPDAQNAQLRRLSASPCSPLMQLSQRAPIPGTLHSGNGHPAGDGPGHNHPASGQLARSDNAVAVEHGQRHWRMLNKQTCRRASCSANWIRSVVKQSPDTSLINTSLARWPVNWIRWVVTSPQSPDHLGQVLPQAGLIEGRRLLRQYVNRRVTSSGGRISRMVRSRNSADYSHNAATRPG